MQRGRVNQARTRYGEDRPQIPPAERFKHRAYPPGTNEIHVARKDNYRSKLEFLCLLPVEAGNGPRLLMAVGELSWLYFQLPESTRVSLLFISSLASNSHISASVLSRVLELIILRVKVKLLLPHDFKS
ncbi:hypothetical protein BHE90_017625 [Fusarium euwallaceae]|uniref:Uncharacterized protein n=1 Tax=Fusarium euwallaceae TaxID=1147111 RepID=A0A430KWZ3_9HYPO|nr:hypothetical protein BHE90_017625 [Fusarium euwallaceae]